MKKVGSVGRKLVLTYGNALVASEISVMHKNEAQSQSLQH